MNHNKIEQKLPLSKFNADTEAVSFDKTPIADIEKELTKGE